MILQKAVKTSATLEYTQVRHKMTFLCLQGLISLIKKAFFLWEMRQRSKEHGTLSQDVVKMKLLESPN